jgi:hypothetical protein
MIPSVRPLRFRLALVVVVAAVAAASLPTGAGEPSPSAVSISTLAWLEGHWRSEGKDAFDEAWLPAGGGVMAAVSRMVHDGEAGMFELSTIEPSAEGLALRIRHFGPGLSPWKSEEGATPSWTLARSGEREVVFEDAARGFPRTIGYRRQAGTSGGPDVLVATLEGAEGGEKRHMEFRLLRVARDSR